MSAAGSLPRDLGAAPAPAAAVRLRPEIFLLSLAVILLEIAWTRVLSFKLVYYFTYLVIALALLGMGAGGIVVALSRRLRAWPTERLVGRAAALAALTVLVGYVVLAVVQLNAFDLVQAVAAGDAHVVRREAATLLGFALLLALPFLCAGVGIAAILASQPAHANRLYGTDLLGAALGCAASVPLMVLVSPPGCVMLAGACAAGAAWRGTGRAARAGVAVLAVVLLGAAARPTLLPDPVVDRVKTLSPQSPHLRHFLTRWSPVFRVDVVDPPAGVPPERFKVLVHDGQWGSIVRGWDGDAASLGFYDHDERELPFTVLDAHPRVTIIGSAGGNEILASLHAGAAHVTAVELNPATVSLLRHELADFSGHVADHPRVSLVNAEGRTFVMRATEPSDLIWFVAPDSYAAMNAATAGAFVLSESYLYTVEMIEESLKRLAPGGVVAIQFGEIDFANKPNRTLRYVLTAREALRRLGIADPGAHVRVSTSTGFAFTASTILVKRDAFTPDETARFTAFARHLDGGVVRWAPPETPDGPIARALSLDDRALAAWTAAWPFDVSVVRDDSPFFWHFVPFRAVLRVDAVNPLAAELGLGEQLLVLLLACAAVLAALLLAAPLVVRWRHWRDMPAKLPAAVYFAALGTGFMFFEISLIQHLTLFLGYPTYSLTVTLCALLLSTALGALWSGRVRMPPARLLPLLLVALAALVVFYRLGLPPLIAAAVGLALPVRVAIALAVLAPLGVCLGTFMPLGLRTVGALGPNGDEYVAWAWAVNGFFSVVSSLLATMLAMSVGFDAVLLVALAVYAVGIGAFLLVPRPALA